MAFEKNPDEIGSLWRKQGRKGEFLSGAINGVEVICFPVDSTNPKAPAYRVLKSTPREGRPIREIASRVDDDLDVPF